MSYEWLPIRKGSTISTGWIEKVEDGLEYVRENPPLMQKPMHFVLSVYKPGSPALPGLGITKTFTTLYAHDFNLGLG